MDIKDCNIILEKIKILASKMEEDNGGRNKKGSHIYKS